MSLPSADRRRYWRSTPTSSSLVYRFIVGANEYAGEGPLDVSDLACGNSRISSSRLSRSDKCWPAERVERPDLRLGIRHVRNARGDRA